MSLSHSYGSALKDYSVWIYRAVPRKAYAAMVDSMDQAIGKVPRADEEGVADTGLLLQR